ncbi:MAG TPA: sigma 54-interacting transcriptional regulator [Aromatoleum sp.]|uniref:sigma 54-interacting transcriptional regulator n=1 Tax=Aromatoleum sp. TaxID=2307007 RepID=UPI002B46578C|nr:sigma 54-interacting transcriptional regulator [Aromatoleum sp.]HJV28656.1 sigma 54-interacting transcriptional regulator [Aromatoleum sp.]
MTGFQTKARIEAEDLRARVNFCADSGQIWLHEQRMLLVHAEAQSSLRKELIETLGMSRARGLLLRMGYASGMRDAELVRTLTPELDDVGAFLAGPQLHSFEGMVGVIPVRVEVDREIGHFYSEFRWINSWECQSHRRHFGSHCGSVCWTQIGYACGYSSAFMGRAILFKEVECGGGNNDSCRIVGRPVEEWDDADAHMRLFEPDPINDQLIDLQTQVMQLRSTIGERDTLQGDLSGSSASFRHALDLLKQAADSESPVLLVGETGVGKELFARALHAMSKRRDRPLDVINCATIPAELVESELFGVEKGAHTGALVSHPGHLERADGSTIFLEEIGDLPLSAQTKLLRVLQKGEVVRLGDDQVRKINVRVVAATTDSLAQWVKEGRFRADLYFRLNAGQIHIPPLRERRDDVLPLAERLLERYAAIKGKKLLGFTDKAKKALVAYGWPGNVRELQNTVERGVILAPNGGRVEVDNLFMGHADTADREYARDEDGDIDIVGPQAGRALCEAVCDGAMTLGEVEKMLVEVAMDKAHGNVPSAARMLGVTALQLADRLKRQ